jgi:hypothetical protein
MQSKNMLKVLLVAGGLAQGADGEGDEQDGR